jgi:hypothetical protein
MTVVDVIYVVVSKVEQFYTLYKNLEILPLSNCHSHLELKIDIYYFEILLLARSNSIVTLG